MVFDQYWAISIKGAQEEKAQVHWRCTYTDLPHQYPNSGPSTSQTHKTRSTCVTSLQVPYAVSEKSSLQMERNLSLEVSTRTARWQFPSQTELQNSLSHLYVLIKRQLHAKHASSSRKRAT